MVEFNKLTQEGTIQQYQVKFEEFKSLMINLNPGLSEAYFVSSYISSLNEELRPTVKMLQPRSVQQVVESVRLQEMIADTIMRKHKFPVRG